MIIEVVGKEIEKIKGDYESYLNGLNMVGEISYSQYSELYDEGTKQIQKAYELGNKANEWQFVSEKGLPKESGRYLVYVGGGENGVYPLDFDTETNDFGYWCLQVGASLGVTDTIFETITERNEDNVIAWKEIVLPGLKESR